MFKQKHVHYFIALALPAIATGIALPFRALILAENAALLYIVAVIVTAANTGMKPAMLSAFASFISLNYFFTQPYYSLLVLQPANILTLVMFVIAAILVGQLAARMREQLGQLRNRERFSSIELMFMEKLAVAITPGHVLNALSEALDSAVNLKYRFYPITNGTIEFTKENDFANRIMLQKIQAALTSNLVSSEKWTLQDELSTARILSDTHDNIAILVTSRTSEASGNGDYMRLLIHQANLALRRTRLVRELEIEKIEREQEAMRSALLSSVSHDFRTPLTSMIGATSTLLELGETLDVSHQKELLESVLTEATRLNGYTQKLLDMTRLGYGELKLSRTSNSIDEILNVVVKRVRGEQKAHRLTIAIEPELPLLHVHAALIEQALYNVLENSFKFSPSESLVNLRVFKKDKNMLVEIEDAGPGIPLAERQKVFEMFHSADRGDHRVAGTGLGLAICKGMIGAHGGSVEIQDVKIGTGCLMVISLPLEDEVSEGL